MCRVSMPWHVIHDPLPSIYWKFFKFTFKFHFGGYKLSYIQALDDQKFNIERKDTLEKFHFILSLHPFVLESINFLCSSPNLFLLCDGKPHWLVYMSLPLQRNEVVEAQLEGLSFSIPMCAVTKICQIYTSVDHF